MTAPILIMGATSGIGRETVREAEARGLPLRAFARSADRLTETDLIQPFPGDARSPEDVARALDGARAVIYALGIKERLAMLWEVETLFSETTKVLLAAMAAQNVARLVAVTGFGAGRSRSSMSALERFGFNAVLGRPYADKARQEDLILASDVNYTIVRPVILTNGRKTEKMKVLRDRETWRNGLVSRAEVAAYLVNAVEEGLDIRAEVVLAR